MTISKLKRALKKASENDCINNFISISNVVFINSDNRAINFYFIGIFEEALVLITKGALRLSFIFSIRQQSEDSVYCRKDRRMNPM